MVHNCSNFFGLSGPHQVKKVAVMDMYQNLDIANYFEKVLLRAEGEQHKATQQGEVYEPYNLLERNCQHLAENTYRFFRSGSIEEDKCTRWLARIIVPIYTAVFLSLIVVGPLVCLWIPRAKAVQDMLDVADTRIIVSCFLLYGLVFLSLAF